MLLKNSFVIDDVEFSFVHSYSHCFLRRLWRGSLAFDQQIFELFISVLGFPPRMLLGRQSRYPLFLRVPEPSESQQRTNLQLGGLVLDLGKDRDGFLFGPYSLE